MHQSLVVSFAALIDYRGPLLPLCSLSDNNTPLPHPPPAISQTIPRGWVPVAEQEISQFTYFQQAGSMQLPVPAVEITYGLERILMALQRVSHFRDIRYNARLTYGAQPLL